jgi:small conductance mechanosensitive channel
MNQPGSWRDYLVEKKDTGVTGIDDALEKGLEGIKAGSDKFAVAVAAAVLLGILLAGTRPLIEGYLAVGKEYLLSNIQYIYAAEILVMGYFIVEYLGKGVEESMEVAAGRTVARALRSITRIVGYGVLLSVLASVFKASSAAALTLGSFIGLVVGFATQQVMGNAIAGVFLAVMRPFKIGDKVKVSGVEGVVTDIGIMYTFVDQGDKIVLVPSSKIVGNIIEVHREKGQ